MSVHGHFYLATVIWVSPSLLLLIRESQVKRMREAESVIVWIVRRGYPLCHDMFVIAKVPPNTNFVYIGNRLNKSYKGCRGI